MLPLISYLNYSEDGVHPNKASYVVMEGVSLIMQKTHRKFKINKH